MPRRDHLVGGGAAGLLGSRLPRREMLLRIAALGVAAGASGSLLAACGSGSAAKMALSKPDASVTPVAEPDSRPAAPAAAAEQQVADLRAGIDELARRAPAGKIGAVGFGSGGSLLWQLLGAGEPRLAAAVPFYGMAADDLDFSRSQDAVLAIYPDSDSTLNESQDNADMAMMKANLVHNSTIYAGTVTGFFDDTGARYDAGAATKAWGATLDWFKQYL